MRGTACALVVVIFFFASPLTAQDPVIETLIGRVSLDKMYADIDTLVSF